MSAIVNSEANVIAVRLFVVFYGGIFPGLSCVMVGINFYFFPKRIFIENKFFEPFYPYNNFFHTLIFMFLWSLFIVNTFLLIGWCFDFYIFKNTNAYKENGKFSLGDDSSEIGNFFMSSVMGGYLIHLINLFAYSFYNIKRTKSYFAKNKNVPVRKQIINLFVENGILEHAQKIKLLIINKKRKIFSR